MQANEISRQNPMERESRGFQLEYAAVQTTARIMLHHLRTPIAFLAHVTHSVDSFLDHAHKWNFEVATQAGHVLLLDRLAVNEWLGLNRRFREARFLGNIRTAAKAGLLNVLIWWRTKYMPNGPDVAAIVLHNAAVNGHLHVIQWLFEVDGHARSIDKMSIPVICSHPEVAYWMHEHQRHVTLSIHLDEAARRGDLEFLKWVKAQGYKFNVSRKSIENAAQGGHLEVLKYLEKQTVRPIARLAFVVAARYGHVHVVEWLAMKKNPEDLLRCNIRDEIVIDDQVTKWIVDHVQWVKAKKDKWIFAVMRAASNQGKLEILKYLYKYLASKELGHNILSEGVRSGKVEIVRWLYAQGARCTDEHVYSHAVRSGNLAMVRWVYDHCQGVRAMMDDMNYAATMDLNMVQWLHEHWPETYTFEAMNQAAASGHLDIVQWFGETRCAALVLAMNAAARYGQLNVVVFLREFCSESEMGLAISTAARHGHLNVVQWLYENGARDREGLSNGLQGAIAGNYVEVVAYLVLQCGTTRPSFDIYNAILLNHFHLLEWLMRYSPDPVLIDADDDWPQSRFMLSSDYCVGCTLDPSI